MTSLTDSVKMRHQQQKYHLNQTVHHEAKFHLVAVALFSDEHHTAYTRRGATWSVYDDTREARRLHDDTRLQAALADSVMCTLSPALIVPLSSGRQEKKANTDAYEWN